MNEPFPYIPVSISLIPYFSGFRIPNEAHKNLYDEDDYEDFYFTYVFFFYFQAISFIECDALSILFYCYRLFSKLFRIKILLWKSESLFIFI